MASQSVNSAQSLKSQRHQPQDANGLRVRGGLTSDALIMAACCNQDNACIKRIVATFAVNNPHNATALKLTEQLAMVVVHPLHLLSSVLGFVRKLRSISITSKELRAKIKEEVQLINSLLEMVATVSGGANGKQEQPSDVPATQTNENMIFILKQELQNLFCSDEELVRQEKNIKNVLRQLNQGTQEILQSYAEQVKQHAQALLATITSKSDASTGKPSSITLNIQQPEQFLADCCVQNIKDTCDNRDNLVERYKFYLSPMQLSAQHGDIYQPETTVAGFFAINAMFAFAQQFQQAATLELQQQQLQQLEPLVSEQAKQLEQSAAQLKAQKMAGLANQIDDLANSFQLSRERLLATDGALSPVARKTHLNWLEELKQEQHRHEQLAAMAEESEKETPDNEYE